MQSTIGQGWNKGSRTVTRIGSGGGGGSNAAAAEEARKYEAWGNNSMANSLNAAQGGVGFAQQGINAANIASGQANDSVFRLNTNAALATGAAQGMSGNIFNVEQQAGLVNQQGKAMLPYADTLKGYANTLWDQGLNVVGQGNSIIGSGNDILNMNAGASGLSGDFVQWLNSIDPNSYVSSAASDVQSSAVNAQGQMDRSLSRSGVSSGRSMSLKQQFSLGLAAALAGAKTRARQQGLADKGKALSGALASAMDMFKTGGDLVNTGLQSQTAAGQNQTSAANIEGQAGQLFGQAGQLQASAGQLRGQQAEAFNAAGRLYGAAGELSLNNASNLIKAYGSATAAQQALAEAEQRAAMFYSDNAEGHAQVAGNAVYGGGSGGNDQRGFKNSDPWAQFR